MAWLTSKLLSAGGMVLAVLMGIAAAFLSGRKSGKDEIKAKSEKHARSVEAMGYEAGRVGAEEAERIRKAKIDTKDRSFFE